MKRTKKGPVEEKKETPEGMISRHALASALLQVKPGLANKDIVEQSTYFLFQKGYVWTFNDKITITRSVDVNITGAVKAKEFYDLLVKFPDNHISVKKSEEGKLLIGGDDREAEIQVDPEIKIQKPNIASLKSPEWKTLPKDFVDSIKFCVFSASRNMARPELTCLFIKEGFCVSCDGFRGTCREMDEDIDVPFMIPADAAIQLSKYNPTSYYPGERGWLHFKNNENTLFSCRTVTDRNYPEAIWDLFDIEGHTVNLPDGFVSIVDRAQTMVTEDFNLDRSINLKIKDKKIKCTGQGMVGRFSETRAIEYDGPDVNINIHPDFLMEILKHFNSMTIGTGDYEGRVLFEGKKFTHFISLSVE